MKTIVLSALLIFLHCQNVFSQSLNNQHALAAGGFFNLAICKDSSVTSWGMNDWGQLGDGTTSSTGCSCKSTAVAVLNGNGGSGYFNPVKAVAAGGYHSMALSNYQDLSLPLPRGAVWCWGRGANGQLGNGSTGFNYSSPRRVTNVIGGMTMIAIAAGSQHSMCLRNNATIYAWGNNAAGQLGDGGTTQRTNPVLVDLTALGVRTVTAIAAGSSHSMALCSDGSVWCWGYNVMGQCGNGNTTSPQLTPVQVVGPGGVGFLSNIIAIAGSGYHSYAIKNDSTVWAWGYNSHGEIGDGTVGGSGTCLFNCGNGADCCKLYPTQVVGVGGIGFLTSVKALASGPGVAPNTSMALKNNGTVYSWGYDDGGMLGTTVVAEQGQTGTPVQVQGLGGVGFITNVKAISVGAQHSFVGKSDGTFWAEGWNAQGQVGIGNTTSPQGTPVKVIAPVCSSLLPVELLSFSVEYNSGIVNCKWETASEINNNYFFVERSIDGRNWSVVGIVQGNGNSSVLNIYEFSDVEVPIISSSATLYYRLKQVDFDGKFEYFGPVAVSILPDGDWQLFLQNSSFENELVGTFIVPDNVQTILQITDLQGRLVKQEYFNVLKGVNTLQVDLNEIEQGIYFLKVYDNKNVLIRKFVRM